MTPYYQSGGITIYCGDAASILPSVNEIVDLCITDPPYGMAFRSNHRTIRHDAIYSDHELPLSVIRQLIGKASRAAYVFSRWDNLRHLPIPTSTIAWIKNNWSMGDLQHEHGRQWEAISFYRKPSHSFIRRIPDVIYADRTGNVLHPTEKPESLLRQLIAYNVGDLVLDPYMGSGTTLLAAKALGRKAIGIEIEEKYCEIAAKRLSQEVFNFSEASS